MKLERIKLGYEVNTGKEISISPSHIIVTGLSQKAGKTTTLESLISRSKLKAVVFRTKVGEKSFLAGTVIPPFYKDKADWQYMEGLIESTMKEKVGRFERAKIIQLCKQSGGNSLLEFKKKVDQRLTQEKINSFEKDILTNIQAYLDIVIPKLTTIQFSKELELVEGLNIIDLERFSKDSEVQSLIIRSVLEEVLYNFKNTIVILPEAWKFIPQSRGNPCKIMVEEFIRQGATNGNYLWIDSQDLTGVDKIPLKQISEYLLGYQSETNEVKHTLDQLPIPKSSKPKADDIMSLGTGIFYFASRELTVKVYIQPLWLDDEKSIKIAKGEMTIEQIDLPKPIAKHEVKHLEFKKPEIKSEINDDRIKEEINELRIDFFSKLSDMQNQVSIISQNVHELSQVKVDENTIIAKVLQKMPVQAGMITNNINKEALVAEVLSKIPKGGSIVYTVSPLEKIRRDFIIDAKNKILDDIGKLSDKSKQMMKYLESRGVGITVTEICVKCFMMKDGSGSYGKTVNELGKELQEILMAKKQTNGNWKPELKDRITELIKIHGATDQEIDQLYDHIMFELLTPQSKEKIRQ